MSQTPEEIQRCADWKTSLAVRRAAILQEVANNRNLYSSLMFDNPNTPFPTLLNEDGSKNVDVTKRKYRFQGKDLSASTAQARRKYEALKCLAYANKVRGKFETNFTRIPNRYRYRMYGCPVLLNEATDNHVFSLPGGKKQSLFPSIPLFAINGVGFGSSPNSDGLTAQYISPVLNSSAAVSGTG